MAKRWFAGVSLPAGGHHLALALFDSTMSPSDREYVSMAEAVSRLVAYSEITVAVAGPLQKGRSVVRATRAPFRRMKPGYTRAADAELAQRGIPVRTVPSVASAAPGGMRIAFLLARRLRAASFAEGPAGREEERWLIETHPTGCFAALLGKLPLPRESLEGRLQRQLALFRERLDLPDPMDVLEEITAHHLLAGNLRLEGLLPAEELEAVAAAFTAYLATLRPERVSWLGGDNDSWICLPAEQLESKYGSAFPRVRRYG